MTSRLNSGVFESEVLMQLATRFLHGARVGQKDLNWPETTSLRNKAYHMVASAFHSSTHLRFSDSMTSRIEKRKYLPTRMKGIWPRFARSYT